MKTKQILLFGYFIVFSFDSIAEKQSNNLITQISIKEEIKDSTNIQIVPKVQVGIKGNVGILNITNYVLNDQPLVRPSVAISLLQNVSEKTKIQYEIYYSIYGTKTINNNIPMDVFREFNYIGFSIDYLERILTKKPLFIGTGIFNEFLFKDITITKNNDGVTEIPNFNSFSKMNIGGQFKIQYHLNMFKKKLIIMEMKYARGFKNIYNRESFKVNGRKSFTEGVYLNLGIFF